MVIDEAHRLRNVYKPSNVIANTLKMALAGKDKLLLTATPLQNSLLELFGLVSFIDEHTFGDLKSFREQFANLNQEQVFQTLKARLKPVCHRTLRRQVLPYIQYTKRLPLVQEFTPEESEDRLYHLVSDYLQRDNLQALPASQRSLMTLVLRKLLASSTFAIAGALTSISNRLKAKLRKAGTGRIARRGAGSGLRSPRRNGRGMERGRTRRNCFPRPTALPSNRKSPTSTRSPGWPPPSSTMPRARPCSRRWTSPLPRRRRSARRKRPSSSPNRAAPRATCCACWRTAPLPKASSCSTAPTPTSARSRSMPSGLQRHQGTDRVTGSRTADMRSALVDYFREQGRIMIATEAGAEGINLQFCSLVVNYDLPWNPQRIEQRIGRCHRYGQKHDVVVVNFLNRKNAADQRVFQLLSEKFQLFEGVFGASDEVLGAIESGVDFEKRIADIYQRCRKPEEIQSAFDQLQLELSLEINEAMTRTRQQLLENFDDEVREKLRVRDEASKAYLNRFERLLMQLTRHELDGHAEFLGRRQRSG